MFKMEAGNYQTIITGIEFAKMPDLSSIITRITPTELDNMKDRRSRSAIFCLMAAALAACGGAEERKAEHFQKAVRYFEQQNLEKSAVEFKNVIQIEPKAAKAYYYLGRIEEGKKNWREAFGLYQKAVELDPNDREAQLKLAQFWLLANDVDKASELLEAVSKEKPSDLDVRLLQVAVANRKGDAESALAQIEKIVAEKPDRPEPYIVLAALYAQKSKPHEAEKALTDGLAAKPDNLELLNALLRLYQQQKWAEPAEQTVKQLIKVQPNLIGHRILLAMISLELGRWNESEQTLRTAMLDFPGEPGPTLVLADFYFKRGETDKSLAELKSAIAHNPNEIQLVLGLAKLYEQTKQPDQAETAYREFIERSTNKPDTLKAKNELAGLLARLGRLKESQGLLKSVLAENAQDHDALLLQGKLALGNKSAQDAISSFRSLLKDQPDATEVLTLLASAYALDGKPGLAQENLERASEVKPDSFALRKNLVDFLVSQKNYVLAVEKIDGFLKQQPRNLEALSLKADVLAVSRQDESLEALLKEIKTAFPDNPLGPFGLGRLYARQQKFDAALNEYEIAAKRSKDDYDALNSITGVYLLMKQPEKAQARVQKAIAENPKNAGAYQVLARLHRDQGRGEDAVKGFNASIKSNPRWSLPYLSLGDYYEKKGQADPAIETYRKALVEMPHDPAIRLSLARVYESIKDYGKAIEQYERVLDDFPGNLLAINNLAAALSLDTADKPNMERALKLAQRLEDSGQPVFLDTLAWIYYQLGDAEKALALQLKVGDEFSKLPVFQYHLGMMYYKRGDAAKAKELLTHAVQSKNDFEGLQEARGVLRILESSK